MLLYPEAFVLHAGFMSSSTSFRLHLISKQILLLSGHYHLRLPHILSICILREIKNGEMKRRGIQCTHHNNMNSEWMRGQNALRGT